MASIVVLRPNHYNGSKITTMFEEYASLTIHFRRTADRKNPWLWVVSTFKKVVVAELLFFLLSES